MVGEELNEWALASSVSTLDTLDWWTFHLFITFSENFIPRKTEFDKFAKISSLTNLTIYGTWTSIYCLHM